MYSPELEELIEAVLADGEISDKERKVLHKRALAEGIDPDEIDVVVEGRLAKRNQAKVSSNPIVPPLVGNLNSHSTRTNKFGEIRKCPNCGSVVEAASVKCEECGYNFVGVAANSSRERLFQIIEEIKERHSKKPKKGNVFGNILLQQFKLGDKSLDEEIGEAIKNMPIPNTKEDLLEFLLYLEPQAKIGRFSDNYNMELTPAYKAKYKECCNKAELFFSDDPLFIKFFAEKKKGFLGFK